MKDYVSKYTLKFNDLASRGFLRAAGAARSLSSTIGRIGAAAGAIGGATIAATTMMNRITAEKARLADSVGVSQSQLSGLSEIAGKIGLEYENVVDLAEEMNNKIGEMVSLGEMTSLEEGLKGIGLQFKEIKDLSPDKQFEAILTAATELGNVQIASSSLDMIFGGEASKMTGLLVSELDRLNMSYSEYIADQKILNNLTQEGEQGATAYIDSFQRLSKFMSSLAEEGFGKLGGAMSPVIDKMVELLVANKDIIATKIDSFVTRFGESMSNIDFVSIAIGAEDFIKSVGDLVSFFADLIEKIGGADNAIKLFFGAFAVGKITSLISSLGPLAVALGPTGAVALAAIAGAALIISNWESIKTTMAGIARESKLIGAELKTAFGGADIPIGTAIDMQIPGISPSDDPRSLRTESGIRRMGGRIDQLTPEITNGVNGHLDESIKSMTDSVISAQRGSVDVSVTVDANNATVTNVTQSSTGIANTGGSNMPVVQ